MKIPRFLASGRGMLGLVLCAIPLLVALIGPLIDTAAAFQSVGLPGAGPSAAHIFGLDYLGRDVLARTLHGGLSVITLGAAASVLAYVVGLVVGLASGYRQGLIDSALMRTVDLILAFPALVVLLIAVSALGTNSIVLLGAVAFIQLPAIARLVRSTTQLTSSAGYVESARARGESAFSVVTNEILPSIISIVLVDFGLRFGQSVLLVASMNFLGLGLQPPAADWGLMIAENRAVIGLNAWSCLVPAFMLLMLVVGINLLGDSFSATLGTSASSGRRRLLDKAIGAASIPAAGTAAAMGANSGQESTR